MRLEYPSQQEIRHLFHYEDGELINRFTRAPRAVKGQSAGSLIKSVGYYGVGYNGNRYQLSRLIWIYHNGDIPEKMQVDHIDRNPLNNRIENLRIASKTQNEWNKQKLGCNFENGKWRARIKDNGRSIHLGMFDTKEEAQSAYRNYAAELHGEFTCT